MLSRRLSASPEVKKSPRGKESPTKEKKARKFSLTGKKGSLPEGSPPANAPVAEAEEPPVVRPEPEGEFIMVELALKRKNGSLGIAIRDDTLVTEIDPGSGGEESGLLVGDYIMELGDTTVGNYAQMLPFLKSMGETSIRALVRRAYPEDDEVAAAKAEAAAAKEAATAATAGVGINLQPLAARTRVAAVGAEEPPPSVAEDEDPRRLAIEAALNGSAGRAAVASPEPQEPSGLSGLLKQLSSNGTAALKSATTPGGLACCQARPAKALSVNGLPTKEEEAPAEEEPATSPPPAMASPRFTPGKPRSPGVGRRASIDQQLSAAQKA